jgi:disulfide bond formation protein DsbB
MRQSSSSNLCFGVATVLALGAIGGAWFSELVVGFVPCMLCLMERWPYYIGLPLAAAAFFLRGTAMFRLLCGGLALVFLVSAGLGVWHAGVEWKLFTAPDCGGRLGGAGSLEDFQKSLSTARVVLCDQAPMRLLGLSFAGWNAVASVMIAGLYALAGRRRAV